MVKPFPSHPNYVGYDAFEGNPRATAPEKTWDLEELNRPVVRSDLSHILYPEPGWVDALERLRLWCRERGYIFKLSPHEYQLARIATPEGDVVLYASRMKGRGMRQRFIKPVPESNQPTDVLKVIDKIAVVLAGRE